MRKTLIIICILLAAATSGCSSRQAATDAGMPLTATFRLHADKAQKATLAAGDAVFIEDSAASWATKWTSMANVSTFIFSSGNVGALTPGWVAAGAVAFTPNGSISANTVQAAIDEVRDEATDDQTAAQVPVTDAGGYFAGTDTEAVLQEIGPLTDAVELTAGANITITNGVISATGGGSFTPDTFPAYEDSARTSGIAWNSTTLAVYDTGTSKWLTAALADSLDPAPVGSCPADGSPDVSYGTGSDSSQVVGNEDADFYVGNYYTAPGNITICKISFRLEKSFGNLSGKTYYAKIFNNSAGNLGTLVTNGTSTGVTGADWNYALVPFSFPDHPVLTSSSSYIVVVYTALDVANVAQMYKTTTDASAAVQATKCTEAGVCRDDMTTHESEMQVYYYD